MSAARTAPKARGLAGRDVARTRRLLVPSMRMRVGLKPRNSAPSAGEAGHEEASGLFVPGEGPGRWPGAA